jgi:oxalyl-CoA decarboxylase
MAVANAPAAPTQQTDDVTDGFHLLIDALKLNGIKTIYNVPGIPITDLGRYAQAQGMRVISFRHEQHAGYAASVAGFLTKMPGVCMTVSAPGFMNGLTALANATTNCWPSARSSIWRRATTRRWINWPWPSPSARRLTG